LCLGYGFVDYDSVDAAESAIRALQAAGIQAQLAKVGYHPQLEMGQWVIGH